MDNSSSFPHRLTLRIPFTTSRLATIARETLNADIEISADKISRSISVDDSDLIIEYCAESAKILRVSVNGLFDSIGLVAQTMESFA